MSTINCYTYTRDSLVLDLSHVPSISSLKNRRKLEQIIICLTLFDPFLWTKNKFFYFWKFFLWWFRIIGIFTWWFWIFLLLDSCLLASLIFILCPYLKLLSELLMVKYCMHDVISRSKHIIDDTIVYIKIPNYISLKPKDNPDFSLPIYNPHQWSFTFLTWFEYNCHMTFNTPFQFSLPLPSPPCRRWWKW